MKKYLFIFCLYSLLFALPSCKPVEKITTKTEYVERLKYDSIYLQKYDSIYVEKSGDTVRIEKYNTIFKDRIRIQKDTINRTDTFKILSTFTKSKEIKENPKENKGFLWWTGLLFWIAITAFTGFKLVTKTPIVSLFKKLLKIN